MAGVDYCHVAKCYENQHWALRDFDLSIADGEFMVLVGPSGCGKSTALRLLAGLEPATDGDLLIGGQRVNGLAPQARDIAMVFQNYALYPHMTVYDNLAFPLRMQGTARRTIRARVEHTAGLLDLLPLLTRKPKQLSGGQRQRVAMGRALVRDPRVFLMDEPLSNLDATLRVQIRTEIAALQKRTGITTIYVTHDQVEAMTLGHRVALLHGGYLQQVDPPQALYERPMNTFVARFIGSPGMNLIPAIVTRSARENALRVQERLLPLPASPALTQRLAPWMERQITLGVRPEAFRPTRMDDPQRLLLWVSAVEVLGHECLLHGTLGPTANAVVVRLAAELRPRPGEVLALAVDLGKAVLFDPAGMAMVAVSGAVPQSA